MASCIRLRLELPPMMSHRAAPCIRQRGIGLGQAVEPSIVAAVEAVHGLEILAAQTVRSRGEVQLVAQACARHVRVIFRIWNSRNVPGVLSASGNLTGIHLGQGSMTSPSFHKSRDSAAPYTICHRGLQAEPAVPLCRSISISPRAGKPRAGP